MAMHKASNAKQKKGGVLFLLKRLAVIAIMAMLCVSFVGGRIRIAEKQKELEQVNLSLLEQTTKNEELQRLVEQGDEDAYIARYAREKLGYIWPGERVFLDITGK